MPELRLDSVLRLLWCLTFKTIIGSISGELWWPVMVFIANQKKSFCSVQTSVYPAAARVGWWLVQKNELVKDARFSLQPSNSRAFSLSASESERWGQESLCELDCRPLQQRFLMSDFIGLLGQELFGLFNHLHLKKRLRFSIPLYCE